MLKGGEYWHGINSDVHSFVQEKQPLTLWGNSYLAWQWPLLKYIKDEFKALARSLIRFLLKWDCQTMSESASPICSSASNKWMRSSLGVHWQLQRSDLGWDHLRYCPEPLQLRGEDYKRLKFVRNNVDGLFKVTLLQEIFPLMPLYTCINMGFKTF